MESGIKSVAYDDVRVTSQTETSLEVSPESEFVMSVDMDGDGNYEIQKSPDEVFVDFDSDGISDSMDFCPDTPIGCLVDIRGCTPNSDIGGACNSLDENTDILPSSEDDDGGGGSSIIPIIGGIVGGIVIVLVILVWRRRRHPAAAGIDSALGINCSACGTPNAKGAEFCKKCGTQLNQ